ncbi:MAG: HEPN domain-containing protein [Microcoleaceae cyanobacterium]
MPKSQRFRDLSKELTRLKKQFIPKISPTYSDRQLALTVGYIVLAHAEIEAYLEDRVWEVVMEAKKDWDGGKTRRTLICLLAFSGETMDEPPDTLTPTKGNKTVQPEKIKISEKINKAIKGFKKVIKQNHGIKEANILALLLPIGIDSDDLDPGWLITLNSFGEKRGLVAHSSYNTIQPPDPAEVLSTVNQITEGLLQVDALINALMR